MFQWDWNTEFAWLCPSFITQSNSDFESPHPMFTHSVCPIHGSKTKSEPKLTPRIFPEDGSHRFDWLLLERVLLMKELSVLLNRFVPLEEVITWSRPGSQARAGTKKIVKDTKNNIMNDFLVELASQEKLMYNRY